MNNEDLTDEELSIVRRHREEKAARAASQALRLSALKLAAEYDEWLSTNGRGSSFSTFVDEFGYEESDCSLMYRIVQKLRETALEPVNE